MKAKYILLACLVAVNIPVYLFLARLLFLKPPAPAAGAQVGDTAPEAKALPGIKDFLDPEFRREGGGNSKLFLLIAAAALVVLIEYFVVLGFVPGLREAVAF